MRLHQLQPGATVEILHHEYRGKLGRVVSVDGHGGVIEPMAAVDVHFPGSEPARRWFYAEEIAVCVPTTNEATR